MFEISNYNNFYSYKPSKSMFHQIKKPTSSILEESIFYSKLGVDNLDHKMTIGSLFTFASRGGDVSGDYDESSTEEDPVIRVWGQDSKGNKFDRKIHVNQIDPSNASTVEMVALGEHLQEQGIQTNLTASSACISFLSGIDVTRKIDFNQYMAEYSDMMGRGGSISETTLMPESAFTKLSVERYLFYLQHEAMENLIK